VARVPVRRRVPPLAVEMVLDLDERVDEAIDFLTTRLHS
jgi:hypothetical protein